MPNNPEGEVHSREKLDAIFDKADVNTRARKKTHQALMRGVFLPRPSHNVGKLCGEFGEDATRIKTPRCFRLSVALLVLACILAMSAPKGPFRLVTVNTAPERAKRLIGRVVEALRDRYTIIHVDNCESEYRGSSSVLILTVCIGIEDVEPKVKEHMPDVLVRLSVYSSSNPRLMKLTLV